MVAVGFLVGFRVQGTVAQFVGAMLLLLLFGFAMSWVMALIGLGTGNAEAAQAAAFPFMAVLVFASNSFVPTSTMPGPLRAYADHQPVSDTVDAVRGLLAGTATAPTVLAAVAWSVAIVAVFAPLAVRRYRRSA